MDDNESQFKNGKVTSTGTSTQRLEIDPVAEKKLVRKLDLSIIPPVTLLYLFSFLDRVNIGNARLYGLEEDLNLSSDRYQTAVSLLFVTYLLFEVPSNIILKHYCRPSRWIAFISVCWGIVATLTGIVQSFGGLIACRLLLGLFESGLFPGLAVYLSFFYTKREIGLRIGYLFVSAALAGAFGGLLAYGIGHMDGIAGQGGWRWIFILEGIPTFLLGIACWWWLADGPETAWFLNQEEKKIMEIRRLQQVGVTDEFAWRDVRAGLKDWKMWAFCCALFGADTMLYGYSTFLPTIIKNIDPTYSSALVQVLTIPCYAVGAISYLIMARISDWSQKRGVYTIIFGVISIAGYAMLISDGGSSVHYAGCFLVALGLYVAVGLPIAWLLANNPRFGKRTTATGLQLMFGNCAGIMSSFLYPKEEGPRFIRGHAVSLGMVSFAMIVYAFMWWFFSHENKKRINGERDYKIEDMSEEEIADLGDENPKFLYSI
ncbi:MFS general substrate transporter, partial [Aureobasidium melanogenum]